MLHIGELRPKDNQPTCDCRYVLDVQARDNGIPSNVGDTVLRIFITDVDDVSPRFDRSFYQEQISEGISIDGNTGSSIT